MNPLPFLGLALIASGYVAATDRLDQSFAADPAAEIAAYPATADGSMPAVYDVLGHGAEPYDRPHCAEHAVLATSLGEDFHENKVASRQGQSGQVMQIFASEEMGTWTVVHAGVDGVSCVVASGTGWSPATSPGMVYDNLDQDPGV